MHADAALEVLRSLRPTSPQIDSETGHRRDAAFLRMSARNDPARWAVVYTPGDRWFTFEIAGGFSLDRLEEDTPDQDVRSLLTGYVDLAVHYLIAGGTTRKSRLLRIPSVVISIGDADVVLRRSVASEVKRFLSLGRAS